MKKISLLLLLGVGMFIASCGEATTTDTAHDQATTEEVTADETFTEDNKCDDMKCGEGKCDDMKSSCPDSAAVCDTLKCKESSKDKKE